MNGTLAELDLCVRYETEMNDLLRDFYRPVLRRSVQYDRLASYFSAVSLAAIGEGFIEFVKNSGTIRMVINTLEDAVDLDVLRGERETPTEHLSAILDPARAADDVHRVLLSGHIR